MTTSAFSVTPAAATQLVIPTQPPASVTAGDPFGLSVAVADPYGNVETTFSGPVTIGLSNEPGSGVLNGHAHGHGDERRGLVLGPHDRHRGFRLHDRGHKRQPERSDDQR